MERLEALFRQFSRRSCSRWWIGERPQVRIGQMPLAIAKILDLPSAADDPFAGDGLVALSAEAAAHVLAVAGTTDLAYGMARPRNGAVADATAALGDLEDDATLLGNGFWKWEASSPRGGHMSWLPMTSATFDCGVIGFDRANAFIFWAVGED